MQDTTVEYQVDHQPGGFTVVKSPNGREQSRLWNPGRKPVEVTETRTESGRTSVRIRIR